MGGEKDDTLVIAGVRLAGRSANRPRTESLILRSNPLMSSINLFIRNSFFRSRRGTNAFRLLGKTGQNGRFVIFDAQIISKKK
jgi:hypothetical protein